ncbi:3-deoxy-D-manno-octulosonic acid transferase [Hydrogenophaga sp. OTU3427]|uniref:3-deoxy-D-manno-octulosonic acid transferase n=1 Tax=Hydrogenophaga sp. OTU3427 TaxID=3043856 RepID=UPI00313C1D9D
MGLWHRMALALYAGVATLAQPLLRRKLRRRGQAEPGYLEAVEERFGHYADAVPSSGWLWLHAVSLGETRAATPLVAQLRALRPDLRLLLTHGTATGRAEGLRLLRPGDRQVWLPWDTPQATRRFLAHFRPAVGVLMETEVWPCLTQACRVAGVPLLLVNARLSDKSLQQALRLRVLSEATYGALAAVYAQTEADAQRLRTLGAPVQGVLGNIKFDALPNAAQLAQARQWRAQASGRRVAMLASSREGEEAMWLAARPVSAGLLWLVVPRHPQRFDEVAAMLSAAGLTVSRRSTWSASGPDAQAWQADVWLGDSLGEMALYYGLADVALLGGSFAPLGGQNLIEAAACGCPVVMGPHTFNFLEAAERALDCGAALRVGDIDEACGVAAALLTGDGVRLAAARQGAVALVDSGRGAVLRTAEVVLQADSASPERQG